MHLKLTTLKYRRLPGDMIEVFKIAHNIYDIYRWRGGVTGKAFGLAISRSQVQILLEAALRNNLRHVVYTYVPLSPSSITWYRPKGGNAMRLGR